MFFWNRNRNRDVLCIDSGSDFGSDFGGLFQNEMEQIIKKKTFLGL